MIEVGHTNENTVGSVPDGRTVWFDSFDGTAGALAGRVTPVGGQTWGVPSGASATWELDGNGKLVVTAGVAALTYAPCTTNGVTNNFEFFQLSYDSAPSMVINFNTFDNMAYIACNNAGTKSTMWNIIGGVWNEIANGSLSTNGTETRIQVTNNGDTVTLWQGDVMRLVYTAVGRTHKSNTNVALVAWGATRTPFLEYAGVRRIAA